MNQATSYIFLKKNALAFPLPTVQFVVYYVSSTNYQPLRDDNKRCG